jgi:dihydroxyacid dehydratase/phosphogluconate dehydratase
MRELLNAGLLHEDVNTVAGFGLSRYTMEPGSTRVSWTGVKVRRSRWTAT